MLIDMPKECETFSLSCVTVINNRTFWQYVNECKVPSMFGNLFQANAGRRLPKQNQNVGDQSVVSKLI